MGGKNSKRRSDASETKRLSRSTDIYPNSSTTDIIRRLPTDEPATVGSLYDATEDRHLTTSSNIPFTSVTRRPQGMTNDPAIYISTIIDKSLPEIIRIDKELYLSIFLNIATSGGISSLIKYPFVVNKYTRFLSYYYPTKRLHLANKDDFNKSESILNSICTTNATHILTEIQYGIHVVIIVQLSPEYEDRLDSLLYKIQQQLIGNTFQLSLDEEELSNHFNGIDAFSNTSDIAQSKNLTNICQKIIKLKPNINQHCALEYTLRSIRSLFPSYQIDKNQYYSIKEEYLNPLIEHLNQLSLLRKSLSIPLEDELNKQVEQYLQQQFDEVQQQIEKTNNVYQERQKKSANLIEGVRKGEIEQDVFAELMSDHESRLLLQEIRDVNNYRIALKEKAQLISDLKQHGIKYQNVKQIVKDNDHNLEEIKKQLIRKDNRKHIFCFDHKLYKQDSTQWNEFYTELINARQNNPQLKFVYADFSYCSCRLPELEILSLQDTKEQQKDSHNQPSPTTASPASKKMRCEEPNIPTTKFVNVLLLGESGVGKSTFINALVNYLKFESLKDACSGQPIALMPVSFLMTVGDNFEEKIVRFGEKESNEDHNHPGQSVTQRCRSYVFTIGTQTKLRLIDTPGMGDTRGLDQDDLNMQHILSFINDLSHINAICILLKPNESRLNVVFRSYFTRLLGFLGENVRNNIIFCFTNTRATFFAPGNTGPLLKKMLESQSITDIPYKKTNTFCFDSESFRYLVARLNGIKFDDFQRDEYKRSWITSVNESNRLLQYICTELKPCPQKYWRSTEHAQFQIIQMVRPMLETLRNTYRNNILLKEKSTKLSIKLVPKILSQPSTICTSTCKFNARLHSDFCVVPDVLHTFTDKCDMCNCDRQAHIDVEYELEYGNSSNTTEGPTLEQLQRMILELSSFFTDIISQSEHDDPIMTALARMITEEETICSLKSKKYLNSKLLDKLIQFNKEYQQKRNNPRMDMNSINLSNIYELIEGISQIHSINEQIDAIKQFRHNCIKNQEKEIL